MKIRAIVVMGCILVALGAVYFFTSRPEAAPDPEPRPYVWAFDWMNLKNVAISLPAEKMTEAWIKHDDKQWYFDRPDGPMVDMARWGGGVPLILSGPGAERFITSEPDPGQLDEYGLKNPRMKIGLTLEDGRDYNIDVGDGTPDGQAYYVMLANAKEVYSVHHTWYEVLERLVREPPYPEQTAK